MADVLSPEEVRALRECSDVDEGIGPRTFSRLADSHEALRDALNEATHKITDTDNARLRVELDDEKARAKRYEARCAELERRLNVIREAAVDDCGSNARPCCVHGAKGVCMCVSCP